MATLQGKAIKDTYKDLLQVSTNNNTGVTSSMSTVEDGEGTSSALKISTTGVQVAGTLDVTGNVTGVPHVDYRGNYSGSTAYVADDVVFFNGSSYIAKQSSSGNAPTNTTYWGLLAQKGTDGTSGTNGTNGTNGTDGTNGTNGTNGTDGDGWTDGSYDSATGKVTFTSDDGLGFETGDLRGSSGSNLTFAKDSGGYQEILNASSGLLITNRSKRVVCFINASTGVSSVPSTISDYSIYGGGGAIQIDTKFANMSTLLGYLGKYHNVGDQQWIIFVETDFTDSALHTDALYNQSFAAFTLVSSTQGTARKWTINNLQGEGIFSNRGPIRIRDMHFKVNSQVGNVSHLFSSYTNGYVLLEGKIAVELGSSVYFYNGIFGATEATGVYNFASNFEIKNDLSGNNAQALYHSNTGGISHAPETIFSGKFNTCRFLQGGFFRFEHAGNFLGTTASNRGPFIQESSYTLPTSYVGAALPAFIFEGGQSQVLHGNQPVSTDVMRYTSVLGQDERFDRHVFDTQGQYQGWLDSNNIIMYPHGNYGTNPSHTNFRGWVFWGVTPSAQMPAKKAFTII
jgi:hypothetical protein